MKINLNKLSAIIKDIEYTKIPEAQQAFNESMKTPIGIYSTEPLSTRKATAEEHCNKCKSDLFDLLDLKFQLRSIKQQANYTSNTINPLISELAFLEQKSKVLAQIKQQSSYAKSSCNQGTLHELQMQLDEIKSSPSSGFRSFNLFAMNEESVVEETKQTTKKLKKLKENLTQMNYNIKVELDASLVEKLKGLDLVDD